MAKAIDDVLASPSRAAELANNGAESVQRFTWERVVDAYVDIYSSLERD